MQPGSNSISRLLRWWFYQHGLYCAKHPKIAAATGISAVILSSLALFNPRGKPFVFEFQRIMEDFFRFVNHYAVPRWHFGAYLLLALYVAWATDKGVKYSVLKRVRSTLGLKTAAAKAERKKRTPLPWSPPFAARFAVGLCGVLTLLFSIILACAIAHSLLGVAMESVFDELPLLVLYMGAQSVYSLLGASTLTYTQSEYRDGGEVYVVDRVKQIAMATSLTGPEEVLTSLSKAALALTVLWPLTSAMGPAMEPVANFWVHAGLAVLFKCLLQMSVLASIVQALVPFWDPAQRGGEEQGGEELKCRVCLEGSSAGELKRCPCRCSGSVGYIHPFCFQQWFERKKSLRCEVCHSMFAVRMLPTSVTTSLQTVESFMLELLPPLLSRLALYLLLLLALGCNKLGLLLVENVARQLHLALGLSRHLPLELMACGVLASPAVVAALGIVPEVLAEWHRRHRMMHWDRRPSASSDGGSSDGDNEELEALLERNAKKREAEQLREGQQASAEQEDVQGAAGSGGKGGEVGEPGAGKGAGRGEGNEAAGAEQEPGRGEGEKKPGGVGIAGGPAAEGGEARDGVRRRARTQEGGVAAPEAAAAPVAA